jgi:hypothetical protein
VRSFIIYTFFSNGATAPWGPRPPHYQGFTITLRHTTLGGTPLDERSARRRDLYLTTHNTHKRHPCSGGIRTCNPNKRPAVDPRLRPHGYWDRLLICTTHIGLCLCFLITVTVILYTLRQMLCFWIRISRRTGWMHWSYYTGYRFAIYVCPTHTLHFRETFN